MANSKIDNIIHLIRCYHHSTKLPVSLYTAISDKTEKIFSIPESITTGKDILEDDDLIPVFYKDDSKPQIIQNKIKEKIAAISLEEAKCLIVIGPVLTEPVDSGELTNMVRSKTIPFHQKNAMQKYFDSCLIVNEEQLYYSVILMQNLIHGLSTHEKSKAAEIQDDAPMSETEKKLYNEKKKDYRLNVFSHSPYAIEQEICKTISNGDTDNAKRILKEINLQPHAKLASGRVRSYKNSMICSCAFMTRAAIAGGVNPDDAFTLSDTYINIIENKESIEELETIEAQMIEGFTNMVKDIKARRYSSPIMDTINYIDSHLCEDIDMKSLAKQVYLNPSYLSTLFHKETGLKISEWIQKKRIEEAAFYVQNGNEDFAQIALFYHFCSQSYFVQCFKKYMGVTPGVYRKQKTNTSKQTQIDK